PKVSVPSPDGRFGPRNVNVSDQRRDPDSLLHWMKLLIERYRESPELAWGSYEVLDTGDDAVLAHRADAEGGTVVAVHNFAGREAEVELVLKDLGHCDVLVDLLVDGTQELPPDGRVRFTLEPYGTRWLRATTRDTAPEDSSAKSQ
ncbi:alpha-glucosidase C-terminal domain-containing protein, partial [Streptosporangium sandarakinum]